MANTRPTKPYWKMTLSELRKATREFDKPLDPSKLRPLTKAERARFDKLRRGPIVSISVYDGKKRKLSVRVDEWLVRRCDEYAKRHNMTRDEMIERSLCATLSFAG